MASSHSYFDCPLGMFLAIDIGKILFIDQVRFKHLVHIHPVSLKTISRKLSSIVCHGKTKKEAQFM